MPKSAPPRQRRTRIVATLGPASSTPEMIEALYRAGVDVFRLNFSHGTVADHAARLGIIRALEEEVGRPIGAIADLQGPKLRVGRFIGGSIALHAGMMLRLDLDTSEGNETRVCLPHPEIIRVATPGTFLLMDDGKVRTEVTEQHKDFLMVRVVAGTTLSNNKGVNVPNVVLPIPALTDKDKRDMAAALDMGIDWIAQSFVQRPEDVAEAKALSGGHAKIISKIEKPSALEQINAIIDLSDAIMLARGDLGVEIPPERVPPVQKQIVRAVRAAGKPMIVATQMLESMITAPTPTRAEASDVATAIYDGTDAIMLSAETASGAYPLESVAMMDRIAQSVESDPFYRTIMDADHPDTRANDTSDAITASAYHIAQNIDAAAIVTFTTGGTTALRAARQRPIPPILCLTEKRDVARRLTLSYGVHPVETLDVQDFDDMVTRASSIARQHGLAQKGQRLVITAGVPFGTPGSTNILRIANVE